MFTSAYHPRHSFILASSLSVALGIATSALGIGVVAGVLSVSTFLIVVAVLGKNGFHGPTTDSLVYVLIFTAALPWTPTLSVDDTGTATSIEPLVRMTLLLVAALLFFWRNRIIVNIPLHAIPLVLFGLGSLTSPLLMDVAFVSTGPSIYFLLGVITVGILSRSMSRRVLLNGFLLFAVLLAAASLAAGLENSVLSQNSRLGGFPVPLHPNYLAVISALGLILLYCRLSIGPPTPRVPSRDYPLMGLLALTLVLTGSRATMLALLIVIGAMQFGPRIVRRLQSSNASAARPLTFAILVLAALAFVISPIGGDLSSFFATRGGSTTLLGTLDTRISAWEHLVTIDTSLITILFGSGMDARTVILPQVTDHQVGVDGLVPAAYLVAGLFGLVCLLTGLILYFRLFLHGKDTVALSIVIFLVLISAVSSLMTFLSVPVLLLVGLICTSTAVKRRSYALDG